MGAPGAGPPAAAGTRVAVSGLSAAPGSPRPFSAGTVGGGAREEPVCRARAGAQSCERSGHLRAVRLVGVGSALPQTVREK